MEILSRLESLTDIEEAKSIIRFLYQENQELKARILKLELEVASLKKDSSNSSKPPSSDITKPKPERRQSGVRRIGGQKGHTGTSRIKFSDAELDERVELNCDCCPNCASDLSGSVNLRTRSEQFVELPEKPVVKIEYKRRGKFCDCCQKIVYPNLPDGIIEGQLFGVRLQSVIAYMKGHLGASYSEIAEYCADVLGIEVSRGMLSDIVTRVSASLEVPYNKLKQAIPSQAKLNIDESGWKDNGKSYWSWIFCNQEIGFFKLDNSRASHVLRDVLGASFNGAITSDFYSAYIAYGTQKQQFCLAHLIRDVKFLTTLPDNESQKFGEKTLLYFKSIFRLWHQRAACSKEKLLSRSKRIKLCLHNYLWKTKLNNGKARTLQKRILKRWNNLFCFFDYPDLFSPTNNNAEQTLRHLVRIRRHTQGSRSQKGRDWIQRIMTVLESCRKQKRSPWEFILNSHQAFHGIKNFPSLLPT